MWSMDIISGVTPSIHNVRVIEVRWDCRDLRAYLVDRLQDLGLVTSEVF